MTSAAPILAPPAAGRAGAARFVHDTEPVPDTQALPAKG